MGPVRIAGLDPALADGKVRTLLDGVRARRGHVPGLMRVLARAPAALAAYLSFGAAMSGGELAPALRERIAIAVAAANGCEACLAAHARLGRAAGLDDAELAAARDFASTDASAAAVLAFSRVVLATAGAVPDAALAAVRAAGFGDAAILEITATVFINLLTNGINNLAGTPPD